MVLTRSKRIYFRMMRNIFWPSIRGERGVYPKVISTWYFHVFKALGFTDRLYTRAQFSLENPQKRSYQVIVADEKLEGNKAEAAIQSEAAAGKRS